AQEALAIKEAFAGGVSWAAPAVRRRPAATGHTGRCQAPYVSQGWIPRRKHAVQAAERACLANPRQQPWRSEDQRDRCRARHIGAACAAADIAIFSVISGT